MRQALFCTCGAKMGISAPGEVVLVAVRAWQRVHAGAGHARCSARQAAQARQAAEKAAAERRRESGETA